MHKNVCSEYPITCYYCITTLKRRNFKVHVKNCGNREIQCPIEGCHQIMLAKEFSQHLIDFLGAHFILQSSMIEKLKKKLKNKTIKLKN